MFLAPRVGEFYPLSVVVIGGIVGAVLGFLVGLLITEVIIGNPANGVGIDWQFWVDIASLVLGALVGASLTRRLAERRAKVKVS